MDSLNVFNQELIDFFNIADVGPLVSGSLIRKVGRLGVTLMLDNMKSLQGLDARLNDALFFTMPEINGQPNPLYRIITPSILNYLFASHAYYKNMINPDNSKLSVSDDMIRYLRETIVKVIRGDAQRVISRHINNYDDIDRATRKVSLFIKNIDNPVNEEDIDDNLRDKRIFNPKNFYHAELLRIIGRNILTVNINMDELRPFIRQVYSDIIPPLYFNSFDVAFNKLEQMYQGEGYPPYENVIINYQKYVVTLAHKYLIQMKNKRIEADRKNRIYEPPPLVEVPQPILSTIDLV